MTKNDYIRLTKQMIERLEALKSASGIGVVTLCQQKLADWSGHQSHTLTPAVINGWLSGAIQSADPVCYRAVIAAYEDLLSEPDRPALKPKRPKNRVEIDDALRDKLKFIGTACSNTSISTLLKINCAPPDLTPDKFSKALNGKTETLLQSHAKFVVSLYAILNGRGSLND